MYAPPPASQALLQLYNQGWMEWIRKGCEMNSNAQPSNHNDYGLAQEDYPHNRWNMTVNDIPRDSSRPHPLRRLWTATRNLGGGKVDPAIQSADQGLGRTSRQLGWLRSLASSSRQKVAPQPVSGSFYGPEGPQNSNVSSIRSEESLEVETHLGQSPDGSQVFSIDHAQPVNGQPQTDNGRRLTSNSEHGSVKRRRSFEIEVEPDLSFSATDFTGAEQLMSGNADNPVDYIGPGPVDGTGQGGRHRGGKGKKEKAGDLTDHKVSAVGDPQTKFKATVGNFLLHQSYDDGSMPVTPSVKSSVSRRAGYNQSRPVSYAASNRSVTTIPGETTTRNGGGDSSIERTEDVIDVETDKESLKSVTIGDESAARSSFDASIMNAARPGTTYDDTPNDGWRELLPK
ncbi:hypothetical protein QFC24_004482 [Naganishia onofrii]|uniref:Uncharacterized protein n=1 Tax=Naganishia onofrii TaxID=1851511 RepID=A0ACC2XCZ1_9TREE|nr:hypothetical protein QFC24_004482 [Naganishia onofrii]